MLGSTTQMAPAEVMAEIFRVLRAMNVSWKKLGPYNPKCLYKMAAAAAAEAGVEVKMGEGEGGADESMDIERAEREAIRNPREGWKPPCPRVARRGGIRLEENGVKEAQVKFEIQVYKLKDERYMIDFQRMDGGVMTCMDAAAALMKNLRLT